MQTGSSTVVGVHAATLAGINYIRYIIPAREGYLFKTPDPGQQSVVFADMLKRNGVFPFQVGVAVVFGVEVLVGLV